ncbi:uncharacterized protein ACA1_386560 [Acanthamoeba castellanii str. Neff]|uniref:Reverse transcriptase domain-containing protein n=1 Tax=Acanthamoeba castellanii (strain ATCC 30010 / Neff) TaxID=1257118 RepID=L8H9C2_ACACF|nr:uncharacterized protein ACA1_386560 [Acanthamoeba castellanii str. Neff]ELR21847.1 hypothetical protein ACA1_386560 [Acanthamoeba castellanii str. Neff]
MKAMIMFWCWQGVMCMVYIDDFMVLAPSKVELQWIRDQVIVPTLKCLSWLREPTKGDGATPSSSSINTIAKAAPILQLYLQSTYQVMGCGQHNWNQHKPLTAEAQQDLKWITTNMQLINRAPLWQPLWVMTIKTDASGYSWGAWVPESGKKARGSFVSQEAKWPIHHK